MALNLVSYDESDNDEESPTPQPSTVENSDIPKPSEKELKLAELAMREKNNLIQSSKKINGKVIIGIPSLADLDEEEIEEKKSKRIIAPVPKGRSSLFNQLPVPKNSHYEPPIKKEETQSPLFLKKSNPLIPHSVMKKQTVKNDSDDEEDSGSFFTIEEPELKIKSDPIAFCNPMYTPLPTQQANPNSQPEEIAYTSSMPNNQMYNLANASNDYLLLSEPDMELDDQALQALQGTKRKLPDDAQIIDVKAEKLTYDPNLSYLKSMSEERPSSSSQDISYNKVQKKKHQITYLAAQAKAREVDLKNQWAQNKSSRRQTQAKYGF